MNDYYLSFNEETVLYLEDFSVDYIGFVDGMSGYLINLRSIKPLPTFLEPFQVFPETPVRVWL